MTPMAEEGSGIVAGRLGENLHRVRRREGLSQERLAVRASLHRTEIGLLEKGERVCRIDTLIRWPARWRSRQGNSSTGSTGCPAPRRRGPSPSGPAQSHEDK